MSSGTVNIHGREYKTVALRVSEFREQCPAKDGWAILTEIVDRTAEDVVVKAMILHKDIVVATGFAEEKRSSSQINRTSALENCETSAIGRALAAFGLGGSEYASANEVANAIYQQAAPRGRKPAPKPRPKPAPALTAEQVAFVEKYRKLIEQAEENDALDALGQIIKAEGLPEHAAESLITAGKDRREFLKERDNG